MRPETVWLLTLFYISDCSTYQKIRFENSKTQLFNSLTGRVVKMSLFPKKRWSIPLMKVTLKSWDCGVFWL